MSETLTGWLPLAEDPQSDPPDDLLVEIAQEAADFKAREAGLNAGPARIVERRPGLFNDDGTYVLGPDGHPVASRGVLFRADCFDLGESQ